MPSMEQPGATQQGSRRGREHFQSQAIILEIKHERSHFAKFENFSPAAFGSVPFRSDKALVSDLAENGMTGFWLKNQSKNFLVCASVVSNFRICTCPPINFVRTHLLREHQHANTYARTHTNTQTHTAHKSGLCRH